MTDRLSPKYPVGTKCQCEHRDHFLDNDACPADCEACGADAHSLVAHPYGIISTQGVKLGAGLLYYCPACEAHEVSARRFV